MLDHECYDLINEALSKAADEEKVKKYFKRAAQSTLSTLGLCIKEEHAYKEYWNDFEELAIDRDLAVWRLVNAHADLYKKIFNDFEEYVKEQLEKDILRRKLE